MQYQKTDLLDWYVYNIEVLLLAALGQATRNVAIEADANFVLMKLSGFADIAAAGQTYNTRVVPLVTLQITDTGSGRNLLNGNTAWSNIVGWGEIPYILPLKRKFKANSTIRVQVISFDPANIYNLRLSFSGYKDFGEILESRGR